MLLKVFFLIVMFSLAEISQALAELAVTPSGNIFYTDDVALFSATRRSGLDRDPCQPVLDVTRTGLGSDMVSERGLLLTNAITTGLGRTAFSMKPQGFIFAQNPEWNQASVAVGLDAELMPHLELELDFHYERNNWSSGIRGDERNAEYENIFQGTGRLLCQLTGQTALAIYVRSESSGKY